GAGPPSTRRPEPWSTSADDRSTRRSESDIGHTQGCCNDASAANHKLVETAITAAPPAPEPPPLDRSPPDGPSEESCASGTRRPHWSHSVPPPSAHSARRLSSRTAKRRPASPNCAARRGPS